MYKVVDLFAGAGGLSLGFMQTRKYDIKVAFENSPYMQETYRLNHPGVEVQGDVCAANYDEIKEKYGDIDVVIGGPPCQGFSNANRQKNHAISQNICVSFMCMALRAEQNMMPRVHAPKMMNAAGWRAGWETTCGSRRRRKERTFSCR